MESGGQRQGGVVSKCLGNRLKSSLTRSLSETGLLLAVGTAPCTYLSMCVAGVALKHGCHNRAWEPTSGTGSIKDTPALGFQASGVRGVICICVCFK